MFSLLLCSTRACALPVRLALCARGLSSSFARVSAAVPAHLRARVKALVLCEDRVSFAKLRERESGLTQGMTRLTSSLASRAGP